jgi:hypothetical protein
MRLGGDVTDRTDLGHTLIGVDQRPDALGHLATAVAGS